MPITTIEETVDHSWITADQTDEGTPISISMVALGQEENLEEQEFTKADFELALKKVSRKVKK